MVRERHKDLEGEPTFELIAAAKAGGKSVSSASGCRIDYAIAEL